MHGKENFDIHVLEPARFAIDPKYAIPQSLSANLVEVDRQDPGEGYLTYAYSTAHSGILSCYCFQPVDWVEPLL